MDEKLARGYAREFIRENCSSQGILWHLAREFFYATGPDWPDGRHAASVATKVLKDMKKMPTLRGESTSMFKSEPRHKRCMVFRAVLVHSKGELRRADETDGFEDTVLALETFYATVQRKNFTGVRWYAPASLGMHGLCRVYERTFSGTRADHDKVKEMVTEGLTNGAMIQWALAHARPGEGDPEASVFSPLDTEGAFAGRPALHEMDNDVTFCTGREGPQRIEYKTSDINGSETNMLRTFYPEEWLQGRTLEFCERFREWKMANDDILGEIQTRAMISGGLPDDDGFKRAAGDLADLVIDYQNANEHVPV